jgi:ABC-type branched-subunit amino acid transport system substrate-binding protein
MLVAFAAPARAESGVTADRILIGQSISLQGGKNDYGAAVLDGATALIAASNAQGGVLGRQIVLKTVDDNASNEQAESIARSLVQQDHVFALFGSVEGGPSVAVMKAAVDLKVPLFGPMAGSPALRRPFQRLVFPVRAEHLEEFRALLEFAHRTGATRVAFVRADSDNGRQHLENMRILCRELGMELTLDLPFPGEATDAQLTDMAARIGGSDIHVVLNHGSVGVYERLIRLARAMGLHTSFSAVNSGSTQLAQHLGELAHGMVFSQVVPSPWERKSSITREYQDVFRKYMPGKEFTYGSLEGYLTAKALVAALRLAGPTPTREGFVKALHAAGGLDFNGLHLDYHEGNHTGMTLVDLSIVTKEGRFRH